MRRACCLSAPRGSGSADGLGGEQPGRAAWEKGRFLAVGNEELVREKAVVLPIPRRTRAMRCGAVAHTESTRWVLGEAHWDVKVHLWSFRLCIFLIKEGKKKGDKGAIRRLFINITGISQRSTEMVEAGWAYQKLYEIVGFDQHLITLRLLGSVSLTLSRRRQGGAGASLVPLLPLHVSVRWVDGT